MFLSCLNYHYHYYTINFLYLSIKLKISYVLKINLLFNLLLILTTWTGFSIYCLFFLNFILYLFLFCFVCLFEI